MNGEWLTIKIRSMILRLSAEEKQKCQKFLDVKEANISAAEIYIDFLTNNSRKITKSDVQKMAEKYGKKDAYFHAFLHTEKLSQNNRQFSEICDTCNINDIKSLNINDYSSDKYYEKFGRFIKVENDCAFTTQEYLPFEGFVYDELDVDTEAYSEHTPIGYFENKFPYFALIKNDQIWMSVIPHEINTMKEPIKHAYGRALVLGLGIGYFLYHIHLKDDVEKIVVIEKDPAIIHLFNQDLLGKFDFRDKIEIIEGDAIEYMKKHHDFDYVFADLWHNVGDGEGLYLTLKALEKNLPDATFDYWIERSILCMLRRQLLTVYEEQLFGSEREDYLDGNNENDFIINRLYFLTEDVVIDSAKKLHDLLSEASLKELAKQIF